MESITSFIGDYIIGFIVLISILVFVHELGHYLFAKMFGVKVESFSIGFGSEIFGWTDKSGTRWKIAPIPFGGYVKMKGEMIERADTPDDESDTFQSKALWQKFLIVFAGPLFNLLLPLILLFVISFFSGIPNLLPKVDTVLEDGPAYGKLLSGDMIEEANGIPIYTFSDMQKIISKNPDTMIRLKVKRENKDLDISIKIGSNNNTGFLGISVAQDAVFTKKYDIRGSFEYTYLTYYKVMTLMFDGLSKLFTGQVASEDIGGPIKIAQMSGDTLKQGLDSWLFFMALLSINLAIINLFPIPALDGGYLLLYIIQGVTRRKLSIKAQSILMQVGFFFLITLMALVVFKDIISLF